MRIYSIVIGFLGLVLLFLQTGCNQVEEPQGILPTDTLKLILIETHLAEANLNLNADSLQMNRAADYYALILDSFKTDSTQFAESMEYYMSKPDIMEKMYQEMLEELSMRESKLPVVKNAPPVPSTVVDSGVLKKFRSLGFKKRK